MRGDPGSIKGLAKCSECGHFASVHHGGGGGRPGGSTCAAPDCDCTKFIEPNDARVPLGVDRLTAVEVARLTGLSVHTLNYWRQSGQGPKSVKAGTRTLYPRQEVERWLAEIDGHTEPSLTTASGWFAKAVEAAEQIAPEHTAPWKLASTYALLAIAESLRTRQPQDPPVLTVSRVPERVDSDFLTIAEVSALARIAVGTLRYWRHIGTGGPPSVKLGRRVLYRRADVNNWLESS